VLAVVLLVAGALVALETSWGKDQLRALVVSQANQYLTATLDIGRLGGSLLRGIELDNVRLARDGRELVAIDRVALSYSVRELIEGGTVIRRLELDRLHVAASRGRDGQWDLAGLVRSDPQRPPRQGPRRPLRIESLVIRDGGVTLGSPVSFGAARVPTQYTAFNAAFSVAFDDAGWRLDFDDASFSGASPPLVVTRLSGEIGSGPDGWAFDDLRVVTPRSDFTLTGRVDRRQPPTRLALDVKAPRFAFQEWSGVLNGLRNIAIESAFEARLSGPLAALDTHIDLRSNGGAVRSSVVLDSSVPGWHGAGTATVQRLDLSRWLNRPDRPSDITGDATFELDLHLGGRFPGGTFTFTGPHAAYLGYEADEVAARGRITDTDVLIASMTATAYGANIRLSSSTLAIDSPYAFHFVGRADGLDLRQLPPEVPVPHVESTLALDYDVAGRFVTPYIRGSAVFRDSEFLDATIARGATGSIDTLVEPFTYAGDGEIAGIDLNHFGRALDIGWLQEPRYDGSVRGRFHVRGSGSDLATMRLDGGGHLTVASIFDGQLSDAEVDIHIAGGSLEGSYDGALFHIDPAIPMADPRYHAALTGRGRGRVAVRDLLVRTVALADYTVSASLSLRDSAVRDLEVSAVTMDAMLARGTLTFSPLVASAPGADLEASGTIELDGLRSSRLDYNVTHANLERLEAVIGEGFAGEVVTRGVLSGPLDRMRIQGEGTLSRFEGAGATALATEVSYDISVPDNDPQRAIGTLLARASFAQAFGRELPELEVDVAYDTGRVTGAVQARMQPDISVALHGTFVTDARARTIDATELSIDALRTSWQLAPGAQPRLAWGDGGFDVRSLELVDGAGGRQHLSVNGSWRSQGGGALRVVARGLSVDTLTTQAAPARFGGSADLSAVVGGTRERPTVAADFAISQGRIRRLAYDRFAGHVDYADEVMTVDLRLDQAPGVWLTAVGQVPLGALDRTAPGQDVRVAVRSSPISLTLVEGVTDVVRDVTGQMELDVTVLGNSRDPLFSGRVTVQDAAFQVAASGARYRNGRMALRLAPERVDVQQLRIDDQQGHPLELTGSLGTRELRVGDLQVALTARDFEVLNNEYGRANIDARLNFTGEFESPRLAGRIAVAGGSQLNVDRILDRALFQPYATRETTLPELDPIVALNPWERMGLDVELNVPGTLRFLGENVQVTPGTPLGLGDINLRAIGDLYLYKDPGQPLYVTGSLDSISGTYAFQGRRFDLDPASSINFRGDLNPELYVMVNRVISGVETRVSIVGPMRQPELRLASVPPLDPSDILSLIVFNTSTNQLSALQQQQLAVRAGTLAAGFLAAPMMAALERSIGIDTLEIEPGADIRSGPRVTIGDEIAPGLVARFSRQFGPAEYDEATLEYYLSRILRIRATFSDAGTLSARSPFRRVERAGIDLLFFFSF
jgi:hypothetical protein